MKQPQEKKTKKSSTGGGIFRMFKKQRPAPAPPPLSPTSSTSKQSGSNSMDKSFVEINELIPSDSLQFESVKRREAPKAPVSPKEEAASLAHEKEERVPASTVSPAAPAPQPAAASSLNDVAAPAKPPRKLTEGGEEEKKIGENKSEKEESEQCAEYEERRTGTGANDDVESIGRVQPEDIQQSSMYHSSSHSGSVSSRICEVIHYSPHGSVRNPSSLSPDPVSDLPPVQRKSNIILNDRHKIKSIPVTHYDGHAKKKQPAPRPPTEVDDDTAITSTTQNVTGQNGQKENGMIQDTMTEEEKRDMELKRRFDKLRRKFDAYQSMSDEEKKTDYARKLHFECVKEHDELRAMLVETMEVTDSLSRGGEQARRSRPAITLDTFTPRASAVSRSPLTISSLTSSQTQITKQLSSSSPGTSRADSPNLLASSYSSISPASSSLESTDAEMKDYRKPIPNGSVTLAFDENSNEVGRKKNGGNGFAMGMNMNGGMDAKSYEKLRAVQRVKEDMLMAKRREAELRSNHTVVHVNLSPQDPAKSAPSSVSSSNPVIRHSYSRNGSGNSNATPSHHSSQPPPKIMSTVTVNKSSSSPVQYASAAVSVPTSSPTPPPPPAHQPPIIRHTRHTSIETIQAKHPQMREQLQLTAEELQLSVDRDPSPIRQSPAHAVSPQKPPSPAASPHSLKSPRLLSSIHPSTAPASQKLSYLRSQSVGMPTYARTNKDLANSAHHSPTAPTAQPPPSPSASVNSSNPAVVHKTVSVVAYINGNGRAATRPSVANAREYTAVVPLPSKASPTQPTYSQPIKKEILERNEKPSPPPPPPTNGVLKEKDREYPRIYVNVIKHEKTTPVRSPAVLSIAKPGEVEVERKREDGNTDRTRTIINGVTTTATLENGRERKAMKSSEGKSSRTNGTSSRERRERLEMPRLSNIDVGGKTGSLLSLKDAAYYSKAAEDRKPIHKRGNSNDILETRHSPNKDKSMKLSISTVTTPTTPPLISELLPAGFQPKLRKVGMPVERNGISLGRVIDSPQQPSPSASSVLEPSMLAPSSSNPMPPASAPPAPPLPPPPDLFTSNTNKYSSPPSDDSRKSQRAQISMDELNAQKSKLKPPTAQVSLERPAKIPQDMRDSLMEEIRNKGGIKGLRSVASPIKTA